MKTSVEISEAIWRRVRPVIRKRGVTLRSLIEEGLSRVVEDPEPAPKYRLKDCSYGHGGLVPGVDFADWGGIAERIYEGRGT